jgi:ATP-dependent DNA helicase RecG
MKELDGGLIIKLFKDNITSDQLTKLGLNVRQVKAVLFMKESGKITNSEYQMLNEVSDRTALRDIDELTVKGILIKEGEKKGTTYKLVFGG